ANLFLSVPFVLHVLGPTEFGVWATLVAFVALAGFLDFGLGNGAMNLAAAAHGRDRADEVAIVFYEGGRALTAVALVLVLLMIMTLALIPWNVVFGLPPS